MVLEELRKLETELLLPLAAANTVLDADCHLGCDLRARLGDIGDVDSCEDLNQVQ